MKQVTSKILKEVQDDSILQRINTHVSQNPETIMGDTTIVQALEQYEFIKELALVSIQNGTFDSLSSKRRNAILTALSQIRQYVANPSQLILTIESLYDTVLSSGLLATQMKQKNYQSEVRSVVKLKREMQEFLSEFTEKRAILDELEKVHTRMIELARDSTAVKDNLSQSYKNSTTQLGEIEKKKNSLAEIQTRISGIEKDLEEKKLSINAFYDNIESYKTLISETEGKAKSVLNSEEKINSLIRQAENALNLKSAEGISAAFSSQHVSASKVANLRGWIIGSASFLLIALILTIWIVSGQWISDPNSISSIVGRVVAVAISLTGATFCARQYMRQKNIAEDYAYKAVLSKSIIAFTEEIKKRDDQKVADYLTKVLDEIHKDPLRTRDSNDGTQMDLYNKMQEVIKGALSKKD